MSGLEQLTAPAAEPLTMDEVRLHVRVETEEEDALLDRLIRVARQRCEQYTGRVLITQSWRLALDSWPGRIVDLPFPPLSAVTSVSTLASDETASAVSAGLYAVDAAAVPGRIIRKSGNAWPVPGRTYNGIQIEFDAGYGANWNSVPEPLRQGMLLLIGHLFERREGEGASLPPAAEGLWHPYRLVRL